MKILYVTTNSNTVNAFLIPHVKFLIEQGNEVGLAFNTIQEVSQEIINLGCKIHQIEFQRNPLKKENLNAYKKIKQAIVEEGYECVHVHTPVASFLTRFACRKLINVTILYTAHGFHFFKGAPKWNWLIYFTLEKIAARWTDGLITMNQEDYMSADKLRLRKAESIYKIHGVGLDLEKFFPQTTEEKNRLRKEYGYKERDFLLIYVGELSYRKHQDLLIEAISLIKGSIPKLKLLLVGDGDLLNDYADLANRLGVEENVEFLGFRKDVHHLLTISDVAISTSRQEGLPVNVMEAMATGLPVIVTNCRGNHDLVIGGENGLIVDVNDARDCSNAISKLYQSEALRRKFGEKSLELIQLYSLENVISELKEIYTEASCKISKFQRKSSSNVLKQDNSLGKEVKF
ncbi:glycosyltransferase family 4 protein [Neobacillus sp. K501]